MPRVTLSIPADVFEGDPRERIRVDDAKVYKHLHGIHSADQWCSSYIDDSFVASLKLVGGRVRFAYETPSNQFMVTTTYGLGRKPNSKELRYLCDQTASQWSDGIGNGSFANHRTSVCSMSLAKAILNQNPEDLPNLSQYFVDAYPMGSSGAAPRIQYSRSGGPNDFLINDLKVATKEGSGPASRELSDLYFQGKFVEKNQTRAIKLLKNSAKLKDEKAIVKLSQLYMNGQFVKQNTMKALDLLEAGVKIDSDLAKVILADLLLNGDPNSHGRAIQLLQESASRAYPSALHRLASCYEHGQGTPKDIEKALELYESARQLGFDSTQDIQRVRKQRGIFSKLFGR